MENKINIAELLKDCPKGMELDCVMYNKVTLLNVDREDIVFPIRVKREDGNPITFTKYGQYTNVDYAKCVIFPKGKTTWEGFVPPCEFKDGDIVATKNGLFIGIVKLKNNIQVNAYCAIGGYSSFEKDINYKFERFATEEEKARLFKAITDNGYRWNAETKTLEKLVESRFFKVGDRIKHKDSGIYCTLGEYSEGISAYRTNIGLSITHKDLEQWELATNKFDITTLKPFNKVLVRYDNSQRWVISFFSHYNGVEKHKYYCINGCRYAQCIPYENNEHLLDTADNCNDYYKNWK